MKTVISRLLTLFLALSILLGATACSFIPSGDEPDDPKDDPADTPKSFSVVLYCDENVSADSTTLIVKEGEDASFTLTFNQGYVFSSCEVTLGDGNAVFDEQTSKLTVSGTTKNTVVYVYTEEFKYDLTEEYPYIFKPSSQGKDTSLPGTSSAMAVGTLVTLSAGDNERVFVGWTVGARYSSGGTLLSESRNFQFRMSPEYLSGGKVTVYANYVDADKLTYDLNGGSVNSSSQNLSSTDYYSVTKTQDTVTVKYTKEYLEFFECGCTFYDDGSFYRDGYLLIEYNTKPDGTGTGYSLGSKIPLVAKTGSPVLYCIWAEQTSAADFTTDEVSIPYAYDANATRAPHWVENGLVITKYNGDASFVVIPEKIGDKYVTAIAEGAFENKSLTTLAMGKRILRIEDGAFTGCSSLTTFYFPDSIAEMSNDAFDAATYSGFKNLYVNATMAPRYSSADTGGLSVKLSRLLASEHKNRIIVVAGSSSYQGLASKYLEDLLDGEYRVINFGTTRTTNGGIYLEAMGALAHSGDMIIYAPENSSYMMGERELYWKTLRDLEHMYNIFRHVDISHYTNVFGAFSDYNTNNTGKKYGRYRKNPTTYESVVSKSDRINKYGDHQKDERASYVGKVEYIDTYFITMNERIKSRFDLDWNNKDQANHKDYTDLTDKTWCSFTDSYYKNEMNRVIASAKSSGASVYFGFCPVDGDKLVEGASSSRWLAAYDKLIDDTYIFDGRIGKAESYVFDHKYFYDCAFHPNDYGRTYRTYQLYLDIVNTLKINNTKTVTELGTSYQGCLFESGAVNEPLTPWRPEE